MSEKRKILHPHKEYDTIKLHENKEKMRYKSDV